MELEKWLSAQEIADFKLLSLPHTRLGVTKKAEKDGWQRRLRVGHGGGYEYAFASLPAEVQAQIRLKQQAHIIAPLTKQLVHDRKAAIAMRDVAHLNDKQRATADARMTLAGYVQQLQASGLSRQKALQTVAAQSQRGALPEKLAKVAAIAVAKHRKKAGFGVRVLHQWVLDYEKCGNPSERFARLAPERAGAHRVKDLRGITWLPDFMAIYRHKNGVSVAEAHRQLVRSFRARHGSDDGCPSLRCVQRTLVKIPKNLREVGRRTGAAMRALQTYVKRDWSPMLANDCWVGDGHSMKMKVAHPENGQPFTPELTLIMDAPSRYIVGWSLSYSESTMAVADALRFAMQQHGIPAMYYSDNGGGQANKTFDADLTGIFSRLGIHHETGLPGHPQGRGIIERVNQTLALFIARQFATYYGPGADEASTHKTLRAVKSYAKCFDKGTPEAQMSNLARNGKGRLPHWHDLLTAIEAGVAWYNHAHRHREIGNVTPQQMRDYLLSQTDASDLVRLTEVEARELFRPEFIRTVARGWLAVLGNDYWHKGLESFDGKKVRVAVDIHDAASVIVRDLNGNWICDAVFDGNKRDAFAPSLLEKSRAQRAARAIARKQEQIAQVKTALRQTIAAQATDMVVLPLQAAPEKTYDFLAVGMTGTDDKDGQR